MDIHGLKVKEWKTILHENTNEKRAGVAILITGKNRHEVENCYETKKKTYDKRVNKSRRLTDKIYTYIHILTKHQSSKMYEAILTELKKEMR